MTKEELEKEAYRWTEKNISVGISMYNPNIVMYCKKAYKDSAEPREKQIQTLGERCNQLLKDKGNLTDELERQFRICEKNADTYYDQRTKAIELLKRWVELYKPKLEGYPITPIQEQTEQFLKEIEK